MESVFYGMIKLNTMTNEEIYENVMGHKPNKEFGLKGSFSWDDIDALMAAVKNCSIPDVVGRSEQLKAFADYTQKRMWEDGDKDLSEFVDEFLRL